jgi:nicotinamidase-related amidase
MKLGRYISGGGKMKKTALVLIVVMLGLVAALSPAATQKAAPSKMKPALLVIDIQNAFLPKMSEQDKKLGMEMITYYIELFRKNGFPIIRVYHTNPQSGPKPDSEAFAFPKSVPVRDDDPKIIKNYSNAFNKTNLDKLLKEKGCNTLFLCGLSAVGCVLATYYGAEDLDYNVLMLKDALISHNTALTKAVQEFCETISYTPLKLLLENAR